MKVATLTDANVFLLVDAVEGRRFAGKRHLVDAYLGGTLGPVGTDVEMELDPSVTALRRRPVNGVTPGSRPGVSFRPNIPFRSNGSDRSTSMKRPMGPSFASKDPDTAAKRVRPTQFPSSSSKSGPSSNDMESVEPVVESVSSAAEGASSPSENDESSAGISSKESASNDKDLKPASDVKPFLDITGFNDDERRAVYDAATIGETGSGESDIEELAEISSFDEFTAVGEGGGVEERARGLGSGEERARGLGSGELTLFNPTTTKAHMSFDPSEFHADFDILAFMQANPKATALRAEFDMSVLDKSSVTHKLLTSLLYDISKASAANAPIKDKKSDVSKAFFNYVFENVWESFPNFEGLMNMGAKVRDGGKDKNIKYFMRHKMQKWYGAMMDKMLGAEQLQQPLQPAGNLQYLQWQ